MTPKAFVDTNVFVYSVDSRDPVKAETARLLIHRLVTESRLVTGYQVAREFVAVVTRERKEAQAWPEPKAWAFVQTAILPFCVKPEDGKTHLLAHRLRAEASLSVFDSFLIASAIQSGCSLLYTEDLQHGREIEGVTILDPFWTS